LDEQQEFERILTVAADAVKDLDAARAKLLSIDFEWAAGHAEVAAGCTEAQMVCLALTGIAKRPDRRGPRDRLPVLGRRSFAFRHSPSHGSRSLTLR
jgi:hypothetical protein